MTLPARKTGIPCFECGKRSGLECPGRKPGEATRCQRCLDDYMAKEDARQLAHLAKLIRSFRRKGDVQSERRLWNNLGRSETRDYIQRLRAAVAR